MGYQGWDEILMIMYPDFQQKVKSLKNYEKHCTLILMSNLNFKYRTDFNLQFDQITALIPGFNGSAKL